MIERSEWREEPNVPRTPLGVFLGTDLVRGFPASWPIFLCVFLYGLGGGFLDSLLPKWAADLLGCVLLLPLGILCGTLVQPYRKRVQEPDPELILSHRVEIALRHGGHCTGDDRGVVSFVDGWLYFEGHRTAFSIRPSDVAKIVREDGKRRLILPEGQRLVIVPAASGRPAFVDAFEDWQDGTSPKGLSRLPPLAPHRAAGLRATAFLQAFSAIISGLVVGLAVPGFFDPSKPHWLEATLGGLAMAAFLAVLARVVAWIQSRRHRER